MRFLILLATLIPVSAFAAKDWEGKWFSSPGDKPLCIVIKDTSTTRFSFEVTYYFGDTLEECRNAKYIRNKREYSNFNEPVKRDGKSYVWHNTSYEYPNWGSNIANIYAEHILEYPGTIPVEYGSTRTRTCQEKFIMRFQVSSNYPDGGSFEETYTDSTTYCKSGDGYETNYFTIADMNRVK